MKKKPILLKDQKVIQAYKKHIEETKPSKDEVKKITDKSEHQKITIDPNSFSKGGFDISQSDKLFENNSSKSGDVVADIVEVFKSFTVGEQEIPVLKNISFQIKSGDFLVIFGASGSGKSTLLHTLLGLEPPTKGKVLLLGEDLYSDKSDDDRGFFRKQHIGMVYQQPNWIRSLRVVENVAFPLFLLGVEREIALNKARDMLKSVKMDNWATFYSSELSGGQQQRIALARALISNPEIIVADEPTGNLDFESGQSVLELLSELNGKYGKTIIMVTHDLEYLKYAKRAIRVFDGQLIGMYDEHNMKDLFDGEINYKRGVNIGTNAAKVDEKFVKSDKSKQSGSESKEADNTKDTNVTDSKLETPEEEKSLEAEKSISQKGAEMLEKKLEAKA